MATKDPTPHSEPLVGCVADGRHLRITSFPTTAEPVSRVAGNVEDPDASYRTGRFAPGRRPGPSSSRGRPTRTPSTRAWPRRPSTAPP